MTEPRHIESRTAPGQAPNGWPQELLEGFRAGRREALSRIYREHGDEVARMLRHGFTFSSGGRSHRFAGYGSAFDLQDALHDVFRAAFEPKARQGYDGLRPYGPYLRTIARNVVLQRFRRSSAVFQPLDEATQGAAGLESPEAPASSPESRVHDSQVRELVLAFLADLAPEDRALVQARFVDGLSQRDAAERLGLGRQQIRARELKVRRRLLAYLRRRGELHLVDGAALCFGVAFGLVIAEVLS